MKVIKFGGTSLGTTDRISNCINLIQEEAASCPHLVVVVSALGDTTDRLLHAAQLAASGDERYREVLTTIESMHLDFARELILPSNQTPILAEVKRSLNNLGDLLHGIFLIRELSLRSQDVVVSFGERLSAYLLAQGLRAHDSEADYIDTRGIIVTDDTFGSARLIESVSKENIRNIFSPQGLYVATGYIAATESGETTTLGRGGSDFTASVIAAALGAEEIVIWTDVDGMMTADPRKVRKAFSLSQMTYEEAMELSHFGARVIHPPTMQPAMNAKIPLRIRNSMNPSFPGTVISAEHPNREIAVTGVSSIEAISLLRLQGSGMVGVTGVSMRVFGALARNKINVILITQASSEHTICFAIRPEDAARAKRVIEAEFSLEMAANIVDPVVVEDGCSIISAVGENMRHKPGISAKLFGGLGRNGVNIIAIAQGSSERNISFVVAETDERKALNTLHEEFFLAGIRSLNVFVAGSGLIASALFKQLQSASGRLLQQYGLDIQILAVTNSRAMIQNEDGVELDSISEQLAKSTVPGGVDALLSYMFERNLPNSIFVDCTASEAVTQTYLSVLEKSIPIVTPNKKAQSAALEHYQALKRTAKDKNVELLFETSVGAGLPVISTLSDLLRSGDDLIEIQAVLSGTLSYIFNTFDGSSAFSDVVKIAQERGFTEPDPREDLNGLDVARKILILAREAGYELEPESIDVENLVPESCRDARDVDAFFDALGDHDASFNERLMRATENKRKLCYIASLRDGKARVALEEIEETHPFYNLSGSDNIISFVTERYNERPLVVKGPGAGADVTAAGVFADIVRLARFRRSL